MSNEGHWRYFSLWSKAGILQENLLWVFSAWCSWLEQLLNSKLLSFNSQHLAWTWCNKTTTSHLWSQTCNPASGAWYFIASRTSRIYSTWKGKPRQTKPGMRQYCTGNFLKDQVTEQSRWKAWTSHARLTPQQCWRKLLLLPDLLDTCPASVLPLSLCWHRWLCSCVVNWIRELVQLNNFLLIFQK